MSAMYPAEELGRGYASRPARSDRRTASVGTAHLPGRRRGFHSRGMAGTAAGQALAGRRERTRPPSRVLSGGRDGRDGRVSPDLACSGGLSYL